MKTTINWTPATTAPEKTKFCLCLRDPFENENYQYDIVKYHTDPSRLPGCENHEGGPAWVSYSEKWKEFTVLTDVKWWAPMNAPHLKGGYEK